MTTLEEKGVTDNYDTYFIFSCYEAAIKRPILKKTNWILVSVTSIPKMVLQIICRQSGRSSPSATLG